MLLVVCWGEDILAERYLNRSYYTRSHHILYSDGERGQEYYGKN